MKILISSDGRHAHYYQRMSWAKAFVASGHTAVMWDIKNVNPFDAFDTFEPDIFLGQLYNLDSATIKCIKERPHLRVGLRAGDWGDHEKEVDKSKYNILFCSNKEKENLKKLKDETGKPDFIHIHYTPEAIKQTHNEFEKLGIPVIDITTTEASKYSGLLLVKQAIERDGLCADDQFSSEASSLTYEMAGEKEKFNHAGDSLMATSFCLLKADDYKYIINQPPPRPNVPAGHWDMDRSLKIGEKQRRRQLL